MYHDDMYHYTTWTKITYSTFLNGSFSIQYLCATQQLLPVNEIKQSGYFFQSHNHFALGTAKGVLQLLFLYQMCFFSCLHTRTHTRTKTIYCLCRRMYNYMTVLVFCYLNLDFFLSIITEIEKWNVDTVYIYLYYL